jgi:hypothetical protein
MISVPGHAQEPLEQWLVDQHRDLCGGLSRFLDSNDGLREVTAIEAGHANVLSALDRHLDNEAGLAAITQPPPRAFPQGLRNAAVAIAAADPTARMALRRNPVILAVIVSDLIVRAMMITHKTRDTRDLVRDLVRARDLALDLDLDLASTLARLLVRDLDHALYLARGRVLARGIDLSPVRSLASDLDVARALLLALDRALALDGTLARGIEFPLANELELARALDDARDLDLGRPRNLDLDLEVARDLDRSLAFARAIARDLDLELARDLNHQTNLVVGRALGIGLVEALAPALLDGVLDDFTQADLAHTDLSSRDLTGVRWSDWGTTWPAETDLDKLRARSREVTYGTGVYVITNPSDLGKAVLHTPA